MKGWSANEIVEAGVATQIGLVSIEKGEWGAVEELLASGANPSSMVGGVSISSKLWEKAPKEILVDLIAKYPDLLEKKSRQKTPPIYEAIARGDIDFVNAILKNLSQKDLLTAHTTSLTNNIVLTPLSFALYLGMDEIASVIGENIDWDLKKSEGLSPLLAALLSSSSNSPKCVDLVLEKQKVLKTDDWLNDVNRRILQTNLVSHGSCMFHGGFVKEKIQTLLHYNLGNLLWETPWASSYSGTFDQTAVGLATRKNDIDLLKLMIAVRPEKTSGFSDDEWSLASREKEMEKYAGMLERDIDADFISVKAKFPIEMAKLWLSSKKDYESTEYLILAIKSGAVQAAEFWLKNGANRDLLQYLSSKKNVNEEYMRTLEAAELSMNLESSGNVRKQRKI